LASPGVHNTAPFAHSTALLVLVMGDLRYCEHVPFGLACIFPVLSATTSLCSFMGIIVGLVPLLLRDSRERTNAYTPRV
jgi:hypothetical protein